MVRTVVLLVLSTGLAGCIHRSPQAAVLSALRSYGLQTKPANTTASRCTSPVSKVRMIDDDTAIVALSQDCASCPPDCRGVVRFETDYLVVRQSGSWKVVKPISGSATLAS